MPLPLKPFYMIRHGETEANAAKIMSGMMDTPLSSLGQKQAKQAAQHARKLMPKPSVVIHSSLSRARDTAGFINQNLDLELIEVKGWEEQDFGDLCGTTYAESQNFIRSGNPPPNGETREQFFARVKEAAVQTLNAYELPLIVCHGGVFRALAGLYDMHVTGIHNCIFYEFQPSESNTDFPWQVFEYHRETGERHVSPFFHGTEDLKEIKRA